MNKLIIVLAPAWMIIIGALMIIPRDGGIVIECIACGVALTRIIGAISVLLGVAGLAVGLGWKLATR